MDVWVFFGRVVVVGIVVVVLGGGGVVVVVLGVVVGVVVDIVVIVVIMLVISSPLASFGCAQYLVKQVSDWMILIFITSECILSQPSYMARWIDLFVGFLINSLLFVF